MNKFCFIFLLFLSGLLSAQNSSLIVSNFSDPAKANINSHKVQTTSDLAKNANIGSITVNIDTKSGVPLNEGFAGFNMRIVDSPWTYTHPEFKAGVKMMNPGFLRYFSGTSGDYFDILTGQYELQWFEGTSSNPGTGGDDESQDDYSSIPSLYKWMEGKGAHRFIDFATMCGETGTKIVVTWNGFYESAQTAGQFARFCKNNNIVVDNWQFCNEPNFFVAPRRYIWNDGQDYAHKMKEIADSIKSVLPDANLALSYGWSWGNNTFASEIKQYQDKFGAYWNNVSIHSYTTHRNSDVLFNDGFLTANKSLESATSNSYFNTMVSNTWKDAKLMITEFGVWNPALKNTNYSAIFVAEYFMRLSQQAQASMIGKHHIASAFKPVNKYQTEIMAAYTKQTPLNTNLLKTGYTIDSEGYGHIIVNKVFKNSNYAWKTTHDNLDMVSKRDGGSIPGIYTTAYKGINDQDYLLVTNKTASQHDLKILLDGVVLNKKAYITYITDNNPANSVKEMIVDSMNADLIKIMPFSVTRIEWQKETNAIPAPLATRIYAVEHNQNKVLLKWWKREIATTYEVSYGTTSKNYTQTKVVNDNIAEITGLQSGLTYYFAVKAINSKGSSGYSNEVSTKTTVPNQTVINNKHEDAGRITIHWESVPFANGYRVKYGTSPGIYTHTIDAGNITGFVFRKMQNNQPYYFSVIPFNGYGDGIASPEITATPVVKRPWVPYLVNAFEEKNGTVRISWTPSDSTYNATFDVYNCPTPWDERNYQLIGQHIAGTTFTDITPQKSGLHYYRIKASNEVGESQFYSLIATVNKVIEGVTGISKHQEDRFILYPNPAQETLHIKNENLSTQTSYKIYDSLGRILKTGKGNEINIADCSKGLLVIELEEESGIYRKLIIKE